MRDLCHWCGDKDIVEKRKNLEDREIKKKKIY